MLPLSSHNDDLPENTEWLIENHVLRMKVKPQVSGNDFYSLGLALMKIVDNAPTSEVHVVFDFENAITIPTLMQILRRPLPRNNKVGWLVIVNVPHVEMQLIINLICKVLKYKHIILPDSSQLMSRLYQLDPLLPPQDN